MSSSRNIVLSWTGNPNYTVECRLGWADEKVTHLVIEPSTSMRDYLHGHLTEDAFTAWVRERLEVLFDGMGVPVPALKLSL